MTIARNIAALLAGFVVGSLINMALVMLGYTVIPPPPGIDVNNPKSFAANMHLFEARHFVFPFLAHALGTLAGALTAYLVAATYRSVWAWVVGVLFLLGGIAAAFLIPAPAWFIALDLVAAYLPAAWLAILIGRRLKQ